MLAVQLNIHMLQGNNAATDLKQGSR